MLSHEIILDHPEAWEKNLDKLLLSIDEFTKLQDKSSEEYLERGEKLFYLTQMIYNQKSKKDEQKSFTFFDKERGREYYFGKTERDGDFKFVFKCLEKRNSQNPNHFLSKEMNLSIEAQGNAVIFLADKKIEFLTSMKGSIIKNQSSIEVSLDRTKIFRQC